MSVGVPIKLLHEAQNHVVTVELKTGEVRVRVFPNPFALLYAMRARAFPNPFALLYAMRVRPDSCFLARTIR